MKERIRTLIRVLLTVAAWIFLITYAHHLGHLYLADLKQVALSPIVRIGIQVIVISTLICLIWVSFPVLPKITKRGAWLILFWALLLAVGHYLSHSGFHQFSGYVNDPSSEMNWIMLSIAGLCYLLVLSIPFVPGVEIGLLIMVIFGLTGILVAYLATVCGITLAFTAGRCLPEHITDRLLQRFGMGELRLNSEATIEEIMPGHSAGNGFSIKLRSWLLNYRYLAVAVSLNLPGNSALGGGGGIGLLCGLSGIFSWRAFICTLIVSTAPIPALAALGLLQLEQHLEKHGFLHEALALLEKVLI